MKVVIDKVSLMTCYHSNEVIKIEIEKALEKVEVKDKYYSPIEDNVIYVVDKKPKISPLIDVHFNVIEE